MKFRVATYNIHKCKGLDQRVKPDRIVEVLREIDAGAHRGNGRAVETQGLKAGDIVAGDHPVPARAYELGCDWPAATTLRAQPGWRSGYYEVVLTIDVDGKARRDHAFFVLRPPAGAPNTILLQLATNTWHAYNDFGGHNLYTGATTSSLQRPCLLYTSDAADERSSVDLGGRRILKKKTKKKKKYTRSIQQLTHTKKKKINT